MLAAAEGPPAQPASGHQSQRISTGIGQTGAAARYPGLQDFGGDGQTEQAPAEALTFTAGALIFLVMLAEAFLRKRKAAANPWGEGATTLEWTLSSPPPFHQFNELPRIKPAEHH